MSTEFESINLGYNRTFKPNKLSIGFVVPLEHYSHTAVPSMEQQLQRIQYAEQLGFSAVWLRDVPFNVPSFGDAGQVYDPFVYLGALAMQTSAISLGVASMVLPLRHPAHVAKAAASVDVLSGGRLILAVASGDRPEEYPALGLPFEQRGQRFRDAYQYIKASWQDYVAFENHYGNPSGGVDLLPKPSAGRVPMLITGSSQQNDGWLAENGDGWMLYPRSVELQQQIIHNWRKRTLAAGRTVQPAMQPLYIDLLPDKGAKPEPIHLGIRTGVHALHDYLQGLQEVGVNHIALNLRFNQMPIEQTLEQLATDLLSKFNHN